MHTLLLLHLVCLPSPQRLGIQEIVSGYIFTFTRCYAASNSRIVILGFHNIRRLTVWHLFYDVRVCHVHRLEVFSVFNSVQRFRLEKS